MSGDYRDELAAAQGRLEQLESAAEERARRKLDEGVAKLRAEKARLAEPQRARPGLFVLRIAAAWVAVASLRYATQHASTTSSLGFLTFALGVMLFTVSCLFQLGGWVSRRRSIRVLDAAEARLLEPRVRVAPAELGAVHARIAVLETEEEAEVLRESARTA